MAERTLHFKEGGNASCAVCGTDLARPVSQWWLSNCWTADRRHYMDQETCLPGASVRTCGVLKPNAAVSGRGETKPGEKAG